MVARPNIINLPPAQLCSRPIAKFFIVILLPVVSFVAVVPILLLSLGNGIMIPFEYCMADSLMLMFSGPGECAAQSVHCAIIVAVMVRHRHPVTPRDGETGRRRDGEKGRRSGIGTSTSTPSLARMASVHGVRRRDMSTPHMRTVSRVVTRFFPSC